MIGEGTHRYNLPVTELTQRERDILSHKAMGLTDKAVGLNLGIAEGTVGRILHGYIFHKLDCHSTTEAVVKVISAKTDIDVIQLIKS